MTELHRLSAGENNRSAMLTFPWQTALLLVAIGIVSSSALAQDATWNVAPGSNDYNTPTNWTPTAAPIGPSGAASFGASGTTSLTFSTGTTVDTFQFNPGASAYTFGLNGHFLEFTGSGIVNNSSNAPTINALGLLQFDNAATAGNAVINNTPGSTTFTGFSTAGTATITNSGGGLLSFTDFSNAGSATITTNAGSLTQFSANSDGGNAQFVTNAGGIVDFSSTAGFDGFNIVTTGSIAGSGRYFLGNNIVHVGGNGDSTTVSGAISACGPTGSECTAASGTSGGSLFKEGSGTLTLSGVNTYTGATVVGGGTLQIAGAGTLGASTAQLQMVTGTLDLGGTTQVTGELTMFGGSIVNGALNSTNYTVGGGLISASLTGTGTVTQDGVGTTTLAGANSYTGGTTIISGTLEAAHASAGVIDALGSNEIVINGPGALRSSVTGTLGNATRFNNGSFGTLSAATGTTLTLTGSLSFFADSIATFGTPTDTGTILTNPALGPFSPDPTASVVVGGGMLRAASNELGNILGTIQSTTVNAGATLDFADFTAAVHNLQGAGSVITGIAPGTTLTLSVDAATSSEFSGVISGSGKVGVSGGGTMILSGDNTYGNGTTIAAGATLQLGNGGTAGSIPGNVANGGALVFNRSNDYVFGGIISDNGGNAGSLIQNGTGKITLTADNTYTGGTTIAAGTLQLGNGGASGSVAGNILDNATIAVNRSDTFTLGNTISGSGALQQIGTGATILTANNTYAGTTTISSGILQLGNGGASGSVAGNIVDNAILAVKRSDIFTLGSTISGSGALQQTGTGTTILTANNTYAGSTTILSGILQLGDGGASGSVAGNIVANATLAVNRSDVFTLANTISGNGAFQQNGTGTTILTNDNSGFTGLTFVNSGKLIVGSTAKIGGTMLVFASGTLGGSGTVLGDTTIAGNLSAGNSPGTLTFGASLTLLGTSHSVFELNSAGIVGGPTNDRVIVGTNLGLGGTLDANVASAGYYRLFDYNGTLTGHFAATNVTGFAATSSQVITDVAHQVNLRVLGAGQQMQFWDGSDQAGNGVVDGGAGTWNASNANWTGAPGQADINDRWRSSVGVFAGAAGGAVTVVGTQFFDTLQFSTNGYALSGGALAIAPAAGATGTLTVDAGITATIGTVLQNGGTGNALLKAGAGTLILTGDNTYTGGTTISAGTLQLGNGGTTGSIVGDVVDNGIFAINHSNALVFNGVISGSGQFQQLGAGTTTLTALESYTGVTTISAGTLALTGAGNIASSSGVIANGTFDISGVAAAGTSIKTLSGSGSVALGAKTLTLTNASDNFAGSIGGAGGVTLGAGTQTLSGNNAYTGVTTIAGGTLALAASGSIASSSGVVDNATFDIAGTTSGTSIKTLSGSGVVALGARTLTLTNASGNFAGVIGGTGGFTLAGGTETLSGANTYTGATTISAGTLAISATGSITSNVTNNATFTNAGTVTGSLTNTGTASNTGIWNGNVQSNTGTISNNLTWTGTISNTAGTFNNNAPGTVSGLVTNAGTATNSGTLNGGLSNTAGTATNSGTINGGATVAGGTLTTTGTISGGLTNAGTVNAAGVVNGAIANNAGTFTTTGALGSNSTFANAAGATLAVGTATYMLQGLLTNSGAVTVANGATLNATTGGVTNNAGGSITVAAGGTVIDDLNNAGAVANNGAYIANVATNTGTVTNNGVWTGSVASNAGTINNNLTWTGTVSNAGAFNNNAGATVSGLLTNTAGTTVNNGALNGGAVISGGTFAGSGTVSNLNVSGGTFAPGNGTPGTFMTVTGNLAFQSAATYLVTLNPTTAAFASVGGTASLNGTAAAVYVAGNYISKKYTILSAAGGVSGTFGPLVNTNVPTNFTSSLSYDGNNAYIDLTLNLNPAPNFGSGLSINQQNAANTLVNFFNTTGGIPLVFGTLTPAGLTQASGELGTGVIQSSIKANDMFLNLLLDPSVAGRAGGFASGSAASQFAADDEEALAYAAKRKASPAERDAYAMARKAPYLAPRPVNRWSVWGAAYGGSATTDGNAIVGSHDTIARAYGVAAGADYKVSPDALIGFALAGGGTSFSIANALGSGNSDLFQAGVFGRQNIGAAYLSAALAYGWQDVTTNRTVTVAGTDVLRANFKAETFSARFEGGYRFATPLAGVTPYAAAQAISFNLPAYAEQVLAGTGTFALNYGAQTTTATRTELGLRTDKSFAVQDGIFTLRGRAAWAHDYNSDRAVGAVFQSLPGAAFVVNGARANPDGALVSAGAEMKWINGFSLAATFEGEFSGNVTSYAGKGVARYTW